LKLHATDVITWTPDGKIILNSGGYRTHTTKDRMNGFLPAGIRVYQKNFNWYINYTGKLYNGEKSIDVVNEKIDFKDGIELPA
jgi:hypothetical protein